MMSSALAIILIMAIVCKSKLFEYATSDNGASYIVDIGDTDTTITIEGDDTSIWYGLLFGGPSPDDDSGGALMSGAYRSVI